MPHSLNATIYHNPKCGTSRNVLQLLIDAGYTVEVIEYLKSGWDLETLKELLHLAGLTPKAVLRVNNTPAVELGLTEDNISDEILLDAMIKHPILVNRPIVKTDKGVKMCRPSEETLSILTVWPKGPYYKKDGSMMIDEAGRKVD